MGSEVFVVPVFFGFLTAVILGPIWLKERTKQSAHKLISQALDKGQTLDPALMTQLTESVSQSSGAKGPDQPRKTLGNGVVLLALAGGLLGASYLSGNFDPSGHAGNGMLTSATILGALGVAFTLLAIVDYASKKKGP